jgi:RNA polymerase sigma-70 factor (ECF subfamily)
VTVDQRTLVELAGQGDHDAFAALARGAIARLDAAARLILRDPELARDAVQEAMLKAWRDLPRLRDPERFDAWLHRLTVRSCIDAARRRRRRVIEVELQPIDGPSTGDTASLVADRDLLDRALRSLEPEARSLIVMHYYLGMSVPETADALGIPLGTAKSRISRSLAQMRVVAVGGSVVPPDPGAATSPARQETST